jgi:hypothetical protein
MNMAQLHPPGIPNPGQTGKYKEPWKTELIRLLDKVQSRSSGKTT